jgi:glycosyltransferase involved in cell wall biosynthesis
MKSTSMETSDADPVAVVSHTLPPETNGQAIMLGRILSGIPADNYRLVLTRQPSAVDVGKGLPARHYYPPDDPLGASSRIPGIAAVRAGLDIPRKLKKRALAIRDILVAERCRTIIVCTGDLFDLPAAAWAARQAGIPLIVYAFDYFAYQFDAATGLAGFVARNLARLFERWTIKRAEAVIVPNEFLGNEYARRYQTPTVIVRNPLQATPAIPASTAWPALPGPARIIYTGSVYAAHEAAFKNLARALSIATPGEFASHIFTPTGNRDWAAKGLGDPLVFHPALRECEVRRVQADADILFLPFGFNTPYQKIINTSAPGKLAEYLASGRPILAHTPADSFLAWYLRSHDCGWVVDEDDPARLLATMREIGQSPALRQSRTARAIACAARDFSLEAARAAFSQAILPKTSLGRTPVAPG